MGVMDEIKATAIGRQLVCRVAHVASEMKPEDQKEFLQACGDHGISVTAIVRWAQKNQVEVSDKQVTRHRRGECPCARS